MAFPRTALHAVRPTRRAPPARRASPARRNPTEGFEHETWEESTQHQGEVTADQREAAALYYDAFARDLMGRIGAQLRAALSQPSGPTWARDPPLTRRDAYPPWDQPNLPLVSGRRLDRPRLLELVGAGVAHTLAAQELLQRANHTKEGEPTPTLKPYDEVWAKVFAHLVKFEQVAWRDDKPRRDDPRMMGSGGSLGPTKPLADALAAIVTRISVDSDPYQTTPFTPFQGVCVEMWSPVMATLGYLDVAMVLHCSACNDLGAAGQAGGLRESLKDAVASDLAALTAKNAAAQADWASVPLTAASYPAWAQHLIPAYVARTAPSKTAAKKPRARAAVKRPRSKS